MSIKANHNDTITILLYQTAAVTWKNNHKCNETRHSLRQKLLLR